VRLGLLFVGVDWFGQQQRLLRKREPLKRSCYGYELVEFRLRNLACAGSAVIDRFQEEIG
jgi:hypothetical protein